VGVAKENMVMAASLELGSLQDMPKLPSLLSTPMKTKTFLPTL